MPLGEASQAVDDWPWDWDFRSNCRYGERGRSLRRRDSNDSLLSECLSEVNRHHASASPRGRGSSYSESRAVSPYRLESPYYEEAASPIEIGRESPHATVNLSQLDMGRSGKRVRRRSLTPPIFSPRTDFTEITPSDFVSTAAPAWTNITQRSGQTDKCLSFFHPKACGCIHCSETISSADVGFVESHSITTDSATTKGKYLETLSKRVWNTNSPTFDHEHEPQDKRLPVSVDEPITDGLKVKTPQSELSETPSTASGSAIIGGKRKSLAMSPSPQPHSVSTSPNMDEMEACDNINQISHKDAEVQSKALEVLRIIRKLGYNAQKDPQRAGKAPSESATGKERKNWVTCQVCDGFQGRPCELKKHLKRHERPYGCTFLTCGRAFGSKNDWKRHENSQHYHLETWRCDMDRIHRPSTLCGRVFYRRQSFRDHLVKDHKMKVEGAFHTKIEECRIGRNCQGRFWCGFCRELVALERRGPDAWNERFDHIADHIEKEGRKSYNWMPVDYFKGQ